MPNTLRFCLFFISLSCFTADAQKNMDIALQYRFDKSGLGVEFRKKTKENYQFRVGYEYEAYSNFFDDDCGRVLEALDDIIICRHYTFMSKSNRLRFGIERNVRDSFFSVSTDVVLSHKSYREINYTSSMEHDAAGNQIPYADSTFFLSLRNQNIRKKNYFSSGLRLGLSMDVPLFKSFYVNVYSYVGVTADFLLSESVDYNALSYFESEFKDSSKPVSIYPSFNYGIGLRYRFGENKNKAIYE